MKDSIKEIKIEFRESDKYSDIVNDLFVRLRFDIEENYFCEKNSLYKVESLLSIFNPAKKEDINILEQLRDKLLQLNRNSVMKTILYRTIIRTQKEGTSDKEKETGKKVFDDLLEKYYGNEPKLKDLEMLFMSLRYDVNANLETHLKIQSIFELFNYLEENKKKLNGNP